MLHATFLSDNVCRCHVSAVIVMFLYLENVLIKVVVCKTELYLDQSGPEERSIARPNIRRLCDDLGAKPSQR